MLTKLHLLTLAYLISWGWCTSFPYVYPRLKLEAKNPEAAGNPLYITPHLKHGNVTLAQNLSRVPITDKMGFKSYAGFLTVKEMYGSNLYFWYFPPFCMEEKSPLILWLQGGPGASSLFGLFAEIGPLVAKEGGFGIRKYHWALCYHLLFIDNPVGAGFSFTESLAGYCKNEDCIAKDLYEALQQFLTLFPYLRHNDLYIVGESYAGKYIPTVAMLIHDLNSKRETDKINLQGLALGNAYCDPVNQIDYGNYLYQHGLLDDNQRLSFMVLQSEIVEQIKQENWEQANVLMDKLIDGGLTNSSYFKQYTGFNYYYNFMITQNDDGMSTFCKLIHNNKVRRNIHVGGLQFNSGEDVQLYLAYDFLKSVAPSVERLLSYYKTMFYSGQLDIIVAYPLTENFLRNLNFLSAEEYRKAFRYIWSVDGEIAGYVKKAGNLTDVLVRNSGHMVPYDQPKWALDMITKFIQGQFF